MCFTCFGISVLTLLNPEPQQEQFAATGVPSILYNQINASESNTALAAMLKRLPNSPELATLRSELKSLQGQLTTAKNNAEADKILKNGLQAIEQRLTSDPNAVKIAEALLDVIASSDNETSTKGLVLKQNLTLKGKSQGWLP